MADRHRTTTVDVFDVHLASPWLFSVFMGGGFVGAALSAYDTVPMGPVTALASFPALVTSLLYPVLRRLFLVRFDAEGVIIVRPLLRRRVPWADIGGFRFVLADSDTESWQIVIHPAKTAPPGRLRPPWTPGRPVLARFSGERVDHPRLPAHGALFHQFARHGLGLTSDPQPEEWQRAHVERALNTTTAPTN
ncbi:hypothetical protein [Streptomyces sp. NPDC101234]|uniref:hypothetical protein n=1 Tax=Streptomyces sp. NPDC101234 TaxID=3366138 RepID=UPI0038219F5C